MRNFRTYEIWQHAVDLAVTVSTLCDGFPKYELFALGDQLRRASVSISSNIAEGASRTSVAEFAHFLEISIGSAFEVETQLLIARKRNYITEDAYESLVTQLQGLERQINSFISKVKQSKPTTNSQKPTATSQKLTANSQKPTAISLHSKITATLNS